MGQSSCGDLRHGGVTESGCCDPLGGPPGSDGHLLVRRSRVGATLQRPLLDWAGQVPVIRFAACFPEKSLVSTGRF